MMHTATRWWWIVLQVAVILSVAGGTSAAEDDRKAVGEAAARFYGALNQMFIGELAPMIDVWSHAKDVVYMGPAGDVQIGWDQVLASWKAQAAMKLGGKVQAEGMRITVGRDLAVTHNVETGENTKDGQLQKVSIRATNVFRKEKGKWKMIGHHTDLLPYLKP